MARGRGQGCTEHSTIISIFGTGLTYNHCPRRSSLSHSSMAKPKLGAKSASKDLVKLGPREVFVDADKARKLREAKPTTSRALVLRNGKYGVQGRGSLSLMSKISGREKLDLLAGTLAVNLSMSPSPPDPQRISSIERARLWQRPLILKSVSE